MDGTNIYEKLLSMRVIIIKIAHYICFHVGIAHLIITYFDSGEDSLSDAPIKCNITCLFGNPKDFLGPGERVVMDNVAAVGLLQSRR